MTDPITGLPTEPALIPVRTHDLVVVVPGIMGSALRDEQRDLWGLQDLRWYARAWAGPSGLDALALSDAELDRIAVGTYDPATARVRPTGLLRFPALMPFLSGVEPYTGLVNRLRRVVASPQAVVEFAYDWRLPVTLNSELLARTIQTRLAWWQQQPEQQAAAKALPGRPAQVVIVAHSMGGLVARGLSLIPGATQDVRSVITLGTPFYGSVKAAALLSTGRETPLPLPAARVQAMAASLPGVYDLLPTYRCRLTTGAGPEDLIRLSAADVADLGGDAALAAASFERLGRLQAAAALPGHQALVGTDQPTAQSLTLEAGEVGLLNHYFIQHEDGELMRDDLTRLRRRDVQGDGTVYRYAAAPVGHADPWHVTQQHGALAATPDTLGLVTGTITGQRGEGIYLGHGDLGLDTPDLVHPGVTWPVVVTATGGSLDPAAVTCSVWDLQKDTDRPLLRPALSACRDGGDGLSAPVTLPDVGMYRVAVKTAGADPVVRLVLCVLPG